MDLVFETSRTGGPTCRVGKFLLHSSYDPQKEAERFLDANLAPGPASTIILLGPGLDYLSQALLARQRASRILRIQYDGRLRDKEIISGPPTWYPGGDRGLGSFLAHYLDEDGLAGIRILEWEAASRAWPQEAGRAKEELKSALDFLASSAATLKTFGRPWVANACRNFLLIENLAIPQVDPAPIVIAAAGPSLELSLDLLVANRKRFRLLAVSSALATLASKDIVPDLVVASDGGFWSRLHLYPLARSATCLASPLSALPSAFLARGLSVLPLVQEGFPELELGSLLGASLSLAFHGTVSGTAIHLAAALGSGPLITVGLDMASLPSRSHSRPHGFDAFLCRGENRLLPLEGILHDREAETATEPVEGGPWLSSRSLALYARALSEEAQHPPLAGRLWRLNPSPIALAGFMPLDSEGFEDLLVDTPLPQASFPSQALPSYEARVELLKRALETWKARALRATAELEQGRKPKDGRDREILRTLDLPDWAAACRAVDEGRDPSVSARALALSCGSFFDSLARRLFSWTT